eukprot:5119634-Pleurochrysis_carterae.AAC.1
MPLSAAAALHFEAAFQARGDTLPTPRRARAWHTRAHTRGAGTRAYNGCARTRACAPAAFRACVH